jgi:hypothetical protein
MTGMAHDQTLVVLKQGRDGRLPKLNFGQIGGSSYQRHPHSLFLEPLTLPGDAHAKL